MKYAIFPVLTVLAGAVLSSCVTTDGDGVRQIEARKTAVSGERTRLGHAWYVKPDCTLATVPTIRVLSAPQHGAAEILREESFPQAKNDYKKCNTKKVMSSVVYYTSAKGFIGHDQMRVRTSFANGVVEDTNYDISIVK